MTRCVKVELETLQSVGWSDRTEETTCLAVWALMWDFPTPQSFVLLPAAFSQRKLVSLF